MLTHVVALWVTSMAAPSATHRPAAATALPAAESAARTTPAKPTAPKGEARGKSHTREEFELEPHAGGYRWRGDGFTAYVGRDGLVRFEDHRPLPAQAALPAVAIAKAAKRTSGGVLDVLGNAALDLVTNPTIAVSDAELFRDSHHAGKMRFLEATQTRRNELRAAHDRENDGGALGGLRARVRAIAADGARPLPERHALVFALWDECDEGADGARARAAIEDETARAFPASGPLAFTPGALQRLNAGRTGARFTPYRTR